MLEKVKDSWEIIVACTILFNICMTVLHGLLGAVKNLTASKLDNKLWRIIGKLIAGAQKGIDYSVANKEHK